MSRPSLLGRTPFILGLDSLAGPYLVFQSHLRLALRNRVCAEGAHFLSLSLLLFLFLWTAAHCGVGSASAAATECGGWQRHGPSWGPCAEQGLSGRGGGHAPARGDCAQPFEEHVAQPRRYHRQRNNCYSAIRSEAACGGCPCAPFPIGCRGRE
jgi:hypothetical protein